MQMRRAAATHAQWWCRGASAVLASACVCSPAIAEELALLAGATQADDPKRGTYAWALEYRQRLLTHLDASIGYLNEGHFDEDHRDGGMLQLWATTGSWSDRFTLAFGAGPYAYFNTHFERNFQGYGNQHGVGAMLSGRADYSFTPRWFGLLDINQILATQLGTRTFMLGLGYRLDRPSGESGPQRPDGAAGVSEARNEFNAFGGETTLNNLTSSKSNTFGLEYRRRATQHLEFSAALLEEQDGAVSRHADVMAQAWVVRDLFARQLVIGLGIGPYAALRAYQAADGRPGARVAGLAAMSFSWRFTRALDLRLTWNRAFTGDDEDRDIVTLGAGWRF
jgi:hypothetical protein